MSQRNHMSELDSDLHILTQRLTEYVTVGMNNAIDVGQNIAEFCRENEELKMRTKEIVKNYIAMESQINQCVQAINHIKNVGASAESDTDLLKVYQTKLDELMSADAANTRRHPKLTELEEELASTHLLEEQLADLRHTLIGGTDDDEVALTQAEVNIKCPYTGQTMTDPVRNKLCGHVYEKEGILGHIKAKKTKAKCPVGGCGNKEPIKETHLEEHRDLKRYIYLLEKLDSQRR